MAIENATIADNGHLILVLTDGEMKDAGNVRGPPGPQGTKGVGLKGDPGEPGTQGAQGPAGVGILGFASGYVDAGTFITLDNIKVSVPTSGRRGLCMAAVAGTVVCTVAGHFAYSSGAVGGTATAYPGWTIGTTATGSFFEWHFPNAGDASVYHMNDYNNKKCYRITLMIGAGYLNNFISIERLG